MLAYSSVNSLPNGATKRMGGHVHCLCRVVEQDIADILLDAWQARTDAGDSSQSTHAAAAKQLIDSADQQDFGMLEKALVSVQDDHDEHTLGDVADRILIYTVQKGWGAACKVRQPHVKCSFHAACDLQ